MGKRNFLFEHLDDDNFRDKYSGSVIVGSISDRLCLRRSLTEGSWEHVARLISEAADDKVAWFPDANVAIYPEAAPVWEAFRRAALERSYTPVVISAPIYRELSQWLNEPHRNESLAHALSWAFQGPDRWAERFALNRDEDVPIYRAFCGYNRLLGFRRELARPVSHGGRNAFGVDASRKADVMNDIKDRLGQRAQKLAKKGAMTQCALGGRASTTRRIACWQSPTHSMLAGKL
jgi:hypothetical protein